jgi:hypothetical protein
MVAKRRTNGLGDRIFVVRIWREPSETTSEDDSWRGQLSHNEQRRHFVGLPKLFALIRDILTPSGVRATLHKMGDDDA